MSILLTGGAGFIGSACLRRLLEGGDEVVVLDNLASTLYPTELKQRQLEWAAHAGGFAFVEGDVRDSAVLEAIFERHDIDCVLHFAGVAGVRMSVERPSVFFDINVTGTSTVLDTARSHGVDDFVLASSSSVYGGREDVPFRENDPVQQPASPYAASKRAMELAAQTDQQLHGGHVTCLRFFTVYGPRQRPQMAIHKFMRRMARDEPIPVYGDGSSGRDYTFVSDIVDGVMRAMQRQDGFRIYNLGGDRVVRLDELITLIGQTVGVEPRIRQLPEQPGDVPLTCADISRARDELGYAPETTLEEGLERMWRWLQSGRRDIRPAAAE